MPSYELALKRREELAEGTTAFHFEKPAAFTFKAGQSVNLELIDPPAEANSARRTFSLVSAPFENELVVATRMRDGSAYKRALKTLPLDSRVKLKGPLGVMTLHEDRARPAVFIAGGIGITPFIGMLRQRRTTGSTIVCSCCTPTGAPRTPPSLPSCKSSNGTTPASVCMRP